jgi:hypothetical protein
LNQTPLDLWREGGRRRRYKPISTAKGRIDLGTNTNQTTRDGVLEIVGLSEQRNDARIDRSALYVALSILSDDTRADLNLITDPENTLNDGTTSNATLKLINFRTRTVNVEGTNNNHVWGGSEVSDGDGDGLAYILQNNINVVLQLGRDGDNRGSLSNSTCKIKQRLDCGTDIK